MDCTKVSQESDPKCEFNNSNKKVDLASVVSCSDDNLNYTYAKSCKGGICPFVITKIFSKNFNFYIYIKIYHISIYLFI